MMALTPDTHPDVMMMQERIASLQADAFRLVEAARERAERSPGDEYLTAIGSTARSIFTLAEMKASAMDPLEFETRVTEIKCSIEEILASVDRELADVAARFADQPELSSRISKTIVEIELAEITRIWAEFCLWADGHAEAAWREAVQELEALLSSSLDHRRR